jgi:hypothetical protein
VNTLEQDKSVEEFTLDLWRSTRRCTPAIRVIAAIDVRNQSGGQP